MRHLFTIILFLKGKSFLTQVYDHSAFRAVRIWINNLTVEDIPEISEKLKLELHESLPYLKEELYKVNNLVNVWSFTCKENMMSIVIVKTRYDI